MEQMLETQPSHEGHFHSGGPPTKCSRGELGKKKKNVLVEVIFMHIIFLPARGISESNSAAIKLN